MSSVSPQLLDRRYRIMAAIPGYPGERHFAARHVELDIPVRIVSVRMHDWQSALPSGAADLFWQRAEASVAVRHPGMVRVRDCFRQSDTCTLVLDWSSEETLAARLAAGGPLPLHEALALGLHLCDALATMTRQAPLLVPLGTLAPETLSRLSSGHYQLTDLGIRNWAGEYPSPCGREETPYRAPEQRTSKASDVRADSYSLAAVLYAALAGAPPALVGQARKPLTKLAPAVPAMVGETIERALRHDPAERYATPESFGAALAGAIRLTMPGPVAVASQSSEPRVVAVPAPMITGRTTRQSRPPHDTEAVSVPPVLRWPHEWVHELSRVAAPKPLLRTGERALAALSSALRSGA